MTVTTQYAPSDQALNSARTYSADFPFSELSSIEVYEIIGTGEDAKRYLVPVSDYTVELFGETRYALFDNASVTFSRIHSLNCSAVRIERNTLIDQTVDFPKDAPFIGRMVEYALDKATLICQEIAERKCQVVVNTEMTQLFNFTGYFGFNAADINAAVAKLYAIMLEIDTTGEDCTDRPEDA